MCVCVCVQAIMSCEVTLTKSPTYLVYVKCTKLFTVSTFFFDIVLSLSVTVLKAQASLSHMKRLFFRILLMKDKSL